MEQKMKASEKLKLLEDRLFQAQKRVGQLELVVYNSSRTNDILKEALQLLDGKLNAVVSLIQSGGQLTEEQINGTIQQLKVESMQKQVNDAVEQGFLKPSEEVTLNSFVVIRELTKEGKLANPRLEFPMRELVEEVQNKFLGKKVGELVIGPPDKYDGEIVEIYEFATEPQQAQEEVSEAPKAEEKTD